jgi:hypothetical protein
MIADRPVFFQEKKPGHQEIMRRALKEYQTATTNMTSENVQSSIHKTISPVCDAYLLVCECEENESKEHLVLLSWVHASEKISRRISIEEPRTTILSCKRGNHPMKDRA